MIQIKNIVKNYLSGDNEVHALKDVSINFRNSEFVSILGPSGCGKTTMLNIIGGLDKYTSGDIIINGVSTKEYKDRDWDSYRNHYIGFVFQSYNLISHLSILENVELALSIAGLNKTEKRKRAIKALKEVGLENQIKKKPNQLSGGQMQRVAIARAIVNEPKIILADEPTGALDSETSVQIMDILKKISDKYLIIMVTHNEELAREYSTRIISILDGEVKDDTDPFNPSEEEIEKDKVSYEKHDSREKAKQKKKKIKTSMNYGTAFMLSLKNLWSKKGKTIIESLAGSIGIIGIALVLAVSAGFTNYINNMQTNTLGSYPLSVSMIAIDYNAITGGDMGALTSKNGTSDDSFSVYNPQDYIANLGHFNFFSQEFIDYIEKYKTDDEKSQSEIHNLKAIQYDYGMNYQLLTKQSSGVITAVSNSSSSSALSGSTTSNFYELIDEKEWILENYNLIGNYSSAPNEIMLVIGSDNKFDISTVMNYGLPYEYEIVDGKTVFKDIKYQDVIDNCEYALLFNDAYYVNSGDNFSVVDLSNTNTITGLFNDAQDLADFDSKTGNVLKLKISGILKAKEDSEMEILNTGLVYNSSLRELFNENAKNSEIVKYAESLIALNEANGITGDAKYNITLPWKYEIEVSELKQFGYPAFSFTSTGTYTDSLGQVQEGIVEYVNSKMHKTISYEDAYNISLQSVGVSSVPFAIYFYPTSFDAKEDIINYISDWNNSDSGVTNKIIYSDATEILTSTLGQLIDIISYVLMAFAGISLVVSSVMIGIITYSSVIERTKEIGVLRSIGARKKDISRIFNSETVLIGFFAGVLGILISWILTFPISALIKGVAGGAITTSMAILKPFDAIILIVISTLLTTIAGTVPAYIASKKDPVKCLRSE